jgi:hypothetical protein
MVAHDDRCSACGGPLELWSEAQWKSLAAGDESAEDSNAPERLEAGESPHARTHPPARD